MSGQPELIRSDDSGVLRVAGTRVRLDTVVTAYDQGCTAEEISQRYPSLSLAQVYSTIAYYLNNQQEICAYLTERSIESSSVENLIRKDCPNDGIRERLLARRRQ